MKQTKSIFDQLANAVSHSEDTGEVHPSKVIKADASVLDDSMAGKFTRSLKKDFQETKNEFVPKPQFATGSIVQEDNLGLRGQEQSTFVQPITTIPTVENKVVKEDVIIRRPESFAETTIQNNQVNKSMETINIHNDDRQKSSLFLPTIDVKDISQVIRILDFYRSLDQRIKDTALKFINIDKSEEDVAVIIKGIIDTKREDKIALQDFVSLKKEERTSRAFSLIGLSNERLIKVRDLVVLFVPSFNSTATINDKVMYCREVELGIETLDNASLNFLEPISELLSISKE